MSEKTVFEYTYSSVLKNDLLVAEVLHDEYSEKKPENREIEGINEIKKLDRKAKRIPLVSALLTGIAGAVLFGTGLGMIFLYPDTIASFIVAAAGTVPVILSIPVYNVKFAKSKKKYGPRILKLTEEIISKNS